MMTFFYSFPQDATVTITQPVVILITVFLKRLVVLVGVCVTPVNTTRWVKNVISVKHFFICPQTEILMMKMDAYVRKKDLQHFHKNESFPYASVGRPIQPAGCNG
jgi:hypothetical protein